jgi:hypothetical protein
MLLSHGTVLKDGDSHSTCDLFYQVSNQMISDQKSKDSSARIVSSGEVKLCSVAIIDRNGVEVESIVEGGELRIKIIFSIDRPFDNPEFHIGTHTTDFIYLTGESSAILGRKHKYESGQHEIEQIIPTYPLVPGTYGIRFAVIDQSGRVVFHGESLKFFNVVSKSMDAPMQDELRLLAMPVKWILPSEQRISAVDV